MDGSSSSPARPPQDAELAVQEATDDILGAIAAELGSSKSKTKYAAVLRKHLAGAGAGGAEQRAAHDRSLALLLRQNAELEDEVSRLCGQLTEATEGILRRGYLHMWRDRTISYASRWGLRYFALQGSQLSYYQDEEDKRPRKTIDLTDCIVRSEGEKKNGQYHVFGVYLSGAGEDGGGGGGTAIPESGLILRLSAENAADARQWIDLLGKAASRAGAEAGQDTGTDTTTSSSAQSYSEGGGLCIDTSAVRRQELEALALLPGPMLDRVKSAEMTLRKSKSYRQLHSGSNPSSPMAPRSPAAGGGHSTKDSAAKKGTRKHGAEEEAKPAESTYQRLRRLFPASRPMHTKSALSPLSSETRPNEQNYRGFFHLGVIILVMTHLRIIYDNFMKYGWLLQYKVRDSPVEVLLDNYQPVLLCLTSWMACILVSLAVEKLAARRTLGSEMVIFCINFVLSMSYAVLPCLWVWFYGTNAVLSMLYLLQSVIIWMKLLSYAHTNRDLRLVRRQHGRSPGDGADNDNNGKPVGNVFAEVSDLELPIVHYPRNITFTHLMYFCVVPTLCYQLNYPRSPRIRWRYVATILLRMVVVVALVIFFVEQYISPTLGMSVQPIEELDIVGIFSLLLRLSVTNTYVWLLGFYFFFHLWMNLFAELTRFGDRLFYKDWWNARTIDQYWQRWNLPVHHWMIRHCYYPILRAGLGKTTALFLVFLLSALFHEVIISVPFKQITMHAFLGMVAQAPLTYLTKKLDKISDNAMIGNCLFWMLFCIVGQPMGVLLHYYDLKKSG
jgi:diacylglycerol O-acyltransferase-1